jgi:CHAT domain-containing protein
MKPCPPPDGSLLPAAHRPFLFKTATLAIQSQKSEIDPLVPKLVDELAGMCATDADLEAWYDELSHWVRWYRLPAYWLTWIYHLTARQKASPRFFLSCELYADTQALMASDLALSSMETAYVGWQRNKAAFGSGLQIIGPYLEQKLQLYHAYYSKWTRPFDYMECNPCSEHLYFELTRQWLSREAVADDPTFSVFGEAPLKTVIAAAATDDFAYYRILAQRFLGLLYGQRGRPDLSLAQYEPALNDALRLQLDTEIGHLRRLMGMTLRTLGKGPEAEEQFREAVLFEGAGPLAAQMMYWQALSARELGDTILHFAGHTAPASVGPDQTAIVGFDLGKMKAALEAYNYGRRRFDTHLTLQSPFPLARAAKQQLFRSFSDNAMLTACVLQEGAAMLAEMEQSGPRQATEVVVEIAAAREAGDVPLAEFRQARAVYYQTLSTMPVTFAEYLASLEQSNAVRRKYQQESMALDGKLMGMLAGDEIVKRMQAASVKETAFLSFHVGPRTSFMVLIDGESGTAAPFDAPFGEGTLAVIQAQFQEAFDKARQAKDEKKMQAALGTLLARYEDLLGKLLEPVLKFLSGMHLKIMPRLQMNAVPLHALRFGDRYLIEHAKTVSYGQTMGMFLENHSAQRAKQSAALRVVMGEKVPFYTLILPRVQSIYGHTCREQPPGSWEKLRGSITAEAAYDTLFACHGQYDPTNLDGSNLMLAGGTDGKVRFSTLFAELDLRGCRSAIMGACESGLARAGIRAEYIGLPSAMLASGVRYVVGALWTIPQLATAVLMARFLEMLKDESADVCAALCEVQREMMRMTREELAAWFRNVLAAGAELDEVLSKVAAMDETPFAHPYHWAGLEAVGDV